MPYQTLAEIYDGLMTETDYNAWAEYIDRLLKQCGAPGRKLMDLGCGTGNITLPLAQRGWQVTGYDLSAEMLAVAKAKAAAQNLAAEFVQGDFTTADFSGYDCAIATFDAFNYVLDPLDLQFLLQNLAMGLNDGGVLVFDINTPYKLRHILGDNIYTHHDSSVDYIWENHFDEAEEIAQMALTFFIKDEASGLYRRQEEFHQQKLYEPALLRLWLEMSGFAVLGIYEQLRDVPLENVTTEHKVVFAAVKKSALGSADDEDCLF